MEDQSEEIFFDLERNQFNPSSHLSNLQMAIEKSSEEDELENAMKAKAIHPWEYGIFKGSTQQQLFDLTNKYKAFNGIQMLFGLQTSITSQDFLEDIDSKVFEGAYERENLIDLKKLFSENSQYLAQKNQYNCSVENLTQKMSEIQKKAFNSISMNKTIGKAFNEHFENFSCLKDQSSFLQNFHSSYEKLFVEAKKIKGPGSSLILAIYEFWMRMFRDFIRQIWRHSEKFSLDLFKKNKVQHVSEHDSMKSTCSSQLGDKLDKRKAWQKVEIQYLENLVESKAIFNYDRLKELANELGRTSTSISAKIQKLLKQRKKEENCCQLSLHKKIQILLRVHPQGMTKQQVTKALSEQYEMGMDDSWRKSVSQLLSSQKNIQKIKALYKLEQLPCSTVPASYATTFKQKLVQCFMHCQGYSADIHTLALKYQELYEINDMNTDLKILEGQLSKALSRYDIFGRDKAKTLYRLIDKEHHVDSFLIGMN